MSKPTLLRPGFVVPPKWMSKHDADRLTRTISIDYVINFISERTSKIRGFPPKRTPKRYGDRVIVLKSQTGSGKSTVLPPELYKKITKFTFKNIAVTQPRIITTIDIPSTIAAHNKEIVLDKNIGYITSEFKRIPKEKGILFCTIGVLSQQIIMSKEEDFIKKYQFIIVDEIHERDIATDLCLFLLKKLLQKNYSNIDCPIVILTSATFDEKLYIDYFDVPEENYIEVVGYSFPIEPRFPDYSIANYIQFAAYTAEKIHLENLDDLHESNIRDIMIFVRDSGVGKKIYEELVWFNSAVLDKELPYIDELNEKINQLYKTGGGRKHYILPVLLDKKNFEKGGSEYQNLFSPVGLLKAPLWPVENINGKQVINTKGTPKKYIHPSRRIIVATNVAETGITIPTLKYCIDTGFYLAAEFYPEFGCMSIISKNATEGMAIQRRGRVGRRAPGIWYPCYTKPTFESFNKDQMSKILISDVSDNLLSILIKEKNVNIITEWAVLKISDHIREDLFQMFEAVSDNWFTVYNEFGTNMSALDFIELPSMQSLSYSIEKLHILGFIDDYYNITITGYYANQMRFIGLELRRMIIAGYQTGSNIQDLITIAAFVFVGKRNIFEKTFKLPNFIFGEDDFQFFDQILIADDFINCVFIWNMLCEFIQENMNGTIYQNNIRSWCEKNGLKYDGILSVISTRDSIIENMVEIGLDIHYNGLGIYQEYDLNSIIRTSLQEGFEEIRRLKYCIYEGFRCNTLEYNKTCYASLLNHTPIKVKSPYISELNSEVAEQTRPMYILVDSYSLVPKFGSSQFEFVAEGFVSVLDNYIEVDERFFLN